MEISDWLLVGEFFCLFLLLVLVVLRVVVLKYVDDGCKEIFGKVKGGWVILFGL